LKVCFAGNRSTGFSWSGGGFHRRNDITIDVKNFSGNAQYYHKDKILHHGTLLYSGNLERLAKALKSKTLKFQDKGVKSVRARVTNISEHLEKPIDVEDFKEYLKNFIMKYHGITKEYSLTEEENNQVLKIQKERFESYQWNYGKNPGFNYISQEKFSGGTVEIYMKINSGIIEDVKIMGFSLEKRL
jgi:lipoate-protein ligase A